MVEEDTPPESATTADETKYETRPLADIDISIELPFFFARLQLEVALERLHTRKAQTGLKALRILPEC